MEIKEGDEGELKISVNKTLAIIALVFTVLSPIVSVTALAVTYGNDVEHNANDIQILQDAVEIHEDAIQLISTNDQVQNSQFVDRGEQLDRLEKKIDKLDDKIDAYILNGGR